MKKLILFLLACCSVISLSAQVAFKLSSFSGNNGDNFSIELRTDKFTKIQSTQFAISYDTTLMEYQTISDFAPGYSNISLLDPTNGGKKGLIRTSWNNPDGENTTYPSNTVLFKMNFKLIGKQCDSNLVKVVNATDKVLIEVIDENGNSAPFVVQDGKVKVNGPNCQGGGGGGGNDTTFTFIIGKIDVSKGGNGCVPITCKNFKKINTFQGNVKWDKTIARYTGIGPNRIAGFNTGGTQISADSTTLRFLWEDVSQQGQTHPDNTVLFELCFDAVGPLNSITDVNIVDVPGNPIEVTAGGINSTEIPYKVEKGSYKVVGAQNILNLYMRDTMGAINSEMCIPIYVDNFTCIGSFQFGVKYDKNKLAFARVVSGGVTVGAANINVKGDSILIIWDSPNGQQVTLANGSTLLSLCFNLTGPCDMNAALSFINLSANSLIEFSGCNDPVTVKTTNANINIKCVSDPPMITIVSIEETRCFGECNGKVTTSISKGSGNFTYRWLNSVGNTPVVPAITTKDASTLCAGTYKLEVTDIGVTPNVVVTSVPVTISSPPVIVVSAQIMSESSAGNDGKIELTATGGTPGYTYSWKRLPNTALPDITSTIASKRCGNYEVRITDSKGCVLMDTFRIECFTPPPTCSINLLDTIICAGDCTASLRVQITGGSIPFTYNWSNQATTIGINNLCAGTYTVTVTDNQSRTCSSTYTVTEPAPIIIAIADTTCSKGNDGSININVTGGTPSYTYEWRNPANQVFAQSQDVTGLAPGVYVVKVTDSKLCTKSLTITISTCNSSGTDVKVILTIDPKTGGGGTSCAGKCDGRITATATGGASPYLYKWSHSASLSGNIADNLCAGNYTVTVTDANAKTATATVRLNDAPAMNINPRRINCASTNISSDGSFEAVVTGGARPYTYLWCSNETTVIATQLNSGNCSLMVTDANGCTATETFTVCSGSNPNGLCFKGNLAISPNGDGYNDNFEIMCVRDYQNTLNIYNRWGHLVYSAVDYINQFNGVDSDGIALNEGTYMYVLTIKEAGKNDTNYKGTVTIVR
ncbi:MAG: T9SS type B sorting domain-containing protein [Saprospiraceae bacterium]|nr:T9SS type B sorting domain-containing protein [Saprospiraceae bacterium]